MQFFDSHAHYDDCRFAEEFDGGTHGALTKAREEGVEAIVNIGSNVASSERSVALAEKYDFVWAAVGIHPSDAQNLGVHELEDALRRIEELAAHEKVRAIGEIGYDYHWDGTDKDRQTYFFEAQMDIAHRLGMPVIIHTRDAMGDTLELLDRHRDVTGVFHSFSGSAEIARQMTNKGWYISFSGPVTYKNSRGVKEAAAIVPENKILIETDCPYLPPTPHRGELNYSGYIKYTCSAVAEIRGKTTDEIAKITNVNARRFFSIE